VQQKYLFSVCQCWIVTCQRWTCNFSLASYSGQQSDVLYQFKSRRYRIDYHYFLLYIYIENLNWYKTSDCWPEYDAREKLHVHLWHVLISVQRFQRRRFKCENLTDGRTVTQCSRNIFFRYVNVESWHVKGERAIFLLHHIQVVRNH
jgi:hypothetical protein